MIALGEAFSRLSNATRRADKGEVEHSFLDVGQLTTVLKAAFSSILEPMRGQKDSRVCHCQRKSERWWI
jgi:hypothetical protein